MSAPQAAAITACTACAAVGGAAAGGAFSSSTTLDEAHDIDAHNQTENAKTSTETKLPKVETPTPWFPVFDEKSDNKTDITAETTIGKTYEKYLVGSFGDTNKNNEPWWNKSFKKYQEDQAKQEGKRNFSDLFGNGKVTIGFKVKDASGEHATTSLNKVCLEAYKKQKSEIEVGSSDGADSTKAKLRDDLWRYCSPLGTRPETVEDQKTNETYNSGKIGATKKAVLLSAKDGVNEIIWSIKQDEFFALNSVSDSLFTTLSGQKDTKKKVANTLRDECKKLYATDPGNSSENANQVIKYCTLLGKE